jgi:hypothetical protein
MTTAAKPVYMGQLGPIKGGDIEDYYFDITNDLDTGDSISSVAYVVTNSAGTVQADAISGSSEAAGKSTFRITAPALAGTYTITATFTLSDSRKLTRFAALWVI